MRPLSICVLLVLTSAATGQDASKPAKRTVEYPWMSISQWNNLHESFLKRGKEGPVDILFLGDSITQGWSREGKSVWDRTYEPLKAANFGIGGDMTQQVLWRITEGKELEGIHPKVVVLMIGTNNFGLSGHKSEEVAQGVTTVVETLQKKLPKTKILLLGIFPRDAKPGTNFRKNIAAVNERIAKLDDGKSIRFLDLSSKFLSPEGTLTSEVMPDYLHLSTKGYQIWADSMRPLLTELLPKMKAAK